MHVDSQKVIQAMIDSTWQHEQNDKHKLTIPGHVLTISRECGSLGEEIAQRCAEQLNVHYFDRELVEMIATSAGEQPATFRHLEKKISQLKPGWLETVFTNRPWLEVKYSRNLTSVLLGISRVGGVVLGRGANYLLGTSTCLRVRIQAPLEIRIERMAERLQVDYKTASKQVQAIDKERKNFIKVLYQKNINHAVDYDLTINTQRISIETAIELIMDGLRASTSCTHKMLK